MTPHDAMRFYAARRDLSEAMFRLSQEVKARKKSMSFTGFRPGAIRAALDAAKKEAAVEFADAMDALASAKADAMKVPAQIRDVAKQIRKEAADARQEFAEFSNGGPPLNDTETTARTPVPDVNLIDKPVGMTILSDLPPSLTARGNPDCIPIHCDNCGTDLLWQRDKGHAVTCPTCKRVHAFAAEEAAFDAPGAGQAK